MKKTSMAPDLETGAVLAAARRHQGEVRAAEVAVLLDAIEWARLHEIDETGYVATWGDSPVPLAGPGAPLVSEFSIAEFATALGMTRDSGTRFIAHSLELAHRLPLLFEQVVAGRLPVWKARRVADQTISLSFEAAAYVDRQVAPTAHKISFAATDRLDAEAIARFMPEIAAQKAEAAADRRQVKINHTQVSYEGTSQIFGELDLADALDLEDALQAGAAALKDAGSELSLDARRAAALGLLARGERPEMTRRRDLTLFVHLSPDTDPSTAFLENAGGHLLTVEQIHTWCTETNTRVTIKPVIDLNAHQATDAYQVPDRLREQVTLRDGTCVFPYCTHNARSCDTDHSTPYQWDGTPGQTNSGNLGPLCRSHHRLKTHGKWTYIALQPGAYHWRSPLGLTYHRDQSGTRDLTPRPVDPPGD